MVFDHTGAIPTVVPSQIWKWMFDDVYGVVNLLLTSFHIIPEKIAYLATPETAIPVIIAVDVWKTVPFMALLILAGLQTIPSDMYEAGAYRWSYRSQNILLFDASVHHANAACGTIKKRFSLLYGQTPSADASAAVEYT